MSMFADLHAYDDERGFVVLALVGLVVVVGAIGLVALQTANSSHQSAVRQHQSAQAFYLAEGAMEYAVKYLTSHPDSTAVFSRSGTVSGGGWSTRADTATSRVVANGSVAELLRVLSLRFDWTHIILPAFAKAIYAQGNITNVTALDESGNPIDSLKVANADSLPPVIQDSLLISLATSQGHVIRRNFTPANRYPNGSFYYSGEVPNVTRVGGNLTVQGGRTVYGIFVVEGNVTLRGGARVDGVIYLPNPGSTVIRGGGDPSESSVTGSIITAGSVSGTGSHVTVRLNTDYLGAFLNESGAEDSFEDRLAFHTWREE